MSEKLICGGKIKHTNISKFVCVCVCVCVCECVHVHAPTFKNKLFVNNANACCSYEKMVQYILVNKTKENHNLQPHMIILCNRKEHKNHMAQQVKDASPLLVALELGLRSCFSVDSDLPLVSMDKYVFIEKLKC